MNEISRTTKQVKYNLRSNLVSVDTIYSSARFLKLFVKKYKFKMYLSYLSMINYVLGDFSLFAM